MAFDRRCLVLAAGAVLALPAAVGAQPQPARPVRVRGKIVAFAAPVLTVDGREGRRIEIRLADRTVVGAFRRIALSDIAAGSFIGTTAEPAADGRLEAREVHVFPEALRGTGEGHHSWDLSAGSTMTNGTVEAVVEGTSGRDLNIVYHGRKVAVHVPATTPIVTPIAASVVDLVPGAQVFLSAAPDAEGRLWAMRVTVEKDGVAPPM